MVRTVHDIRQAPLFLPDPGWEPSMELPSLRGRRRVALDTETHDPGIAAKRGSSWARAGEGEVVGVSLALEDGPARYYPLRHPEGNVADPERLLAALRAEFEAFDGELVMMKADYDLGWLRREGIRPGGRVFDVMAAEALIDPEKDGFSLNRIAQGYGLPPKDETLLRETAAAFGLHKSQEVKANLWRLPGTHVGPYGEHDARLPLLIAERQRPLLASLGLERVNEVEQALIPLHVLMRERGVRVDLDRCERTRRLLQEREREQLLEIHRLTGLSVHVWEPSSVAAAFMAVGVPFPSTALHQPSFQQEWLESHPHPLAGAVRRARRYNKAWSTFIDGMILGHVDGNAHVHPEWHPLPSDEGGVPAGRYSCTEPNLQQVPARDPEVGPLIRSLFVPEDDEEWFTTDISQQEPRFTVHFAALRARQHPDRFPVALEAARLIREDPRIDYHQMVADITGLPRKAAKTLNLGIAYGMGGAKLCRGLGLPTKVWSPDGVHELDVAGDEGRAIINRYHERFPFIRPLSQELDGLAQERGWVRTYLGRYCRFDLWVPVERDWEYHKALPRITAEERYGTALRRAFTHKGLNRLIQGSSADMIKLAMLRVWRETGQVPALTIHDELDLSLGSEEQMRAVDACVRSCVELLVPISTDMERGPSWGETTKFT